MGEGEFNSEENLKHYLAMAYAKVTLHDCEADTKLMGCIILFPAPLSRSFAPKYTGEQERANIVRHMQITILTNALSIFQVFRFQVPKNDRFRKC